MAASFTTRELVLTAEGRRWLQGRLEAAEGRLGRVTSDLAAERTPELLAEQQHLQEQVEQLRGDLRRAVSPSEIADDPDLVELGDEVEVRFPDGSVEVFLLVHPLEAGMDERRTSADSPVARAVLGSRVGDRVTVTSPGGVYSCVVQDRRRLE
jgi:transcription elongation factor GreA